MANLPATIPQKTAFQVSDDHLELIADYLHAGIKPSEIARRLAPDDPQKRAMWRRRIWSIVYHDNRIPVALAGRAKVEMMLGLGPASRALVRRASAGRPDAIKLLFEASGFHNPRVRHEHSGEVTIKVDMPRPKFTDEQEAVTDAEVVED